MANDKKTHLGSSVFTHQDDATAPIHTTHPDHQDAHIYGGDVPPKHELEEVVLGPPAFGSPDPRTLGHVMSPIHESTSAPPLDPAFVALQKRTQAGVGEITEEDLQSKTKDELHALAQDLGVKVNKSASKQEIIDAIFEEETSETTEEEAQEDAGKTNTVTDYTEMSKADLLNDAQQRGLEVNTSNSKDEIITALEENDKSKSQSQ